MDDHGDHSHHQMGPMKMDGMAGAAKESTGEMGMGGIGGMMHGMKMYFHGGTSETILFSFWKISNIGGLIGSMVGIFLLAMLYEGLKVLREYLQQREAERLAALAVASSPRSENSTAGVVSQSSSVRIRKSPWRVAHWIQTLLHILQITVSYFLMLIFMTYNVWLCIAVVLGAGAGYFAFGWTRKISVADQNEHCH